LDKSLPVPGIIRGFVRKRIVDKVSSSLMSDIDGQVKYLYLRFENVDERRYLKGNYGKDNHVNDDGVIETVVGIRKRIEGGVNYQIFGPELHTNDAGEHFFELYRNRRTPLRSGVKQGTIRLEDSAGEWYKTVYCCSCPCVVRDMSGDEPYKPIDIKSVVVNFENDVGF